MNELPPSDDRPDDVDDLYRRASALDASRPSESVRRAVLDHAAQLAAERAALNNPVKVDLTARPKRQTWQRPAIFGTLAAAALAGLLVAPQLIAPRGPAVRTLSSTEGLRPQAAPAPAPDQAQAPARAQAPAPDQAPAAAQAPAPAQAPASAPTAPASAKVQGYAESRADAPDAARTANSARSGVKNPPAEAQYQPDAQRESPQSGASDTGARRAQRVTSGISALSASPPQAAASAAPAARLTDPSAELRRAAEAGDVPSLQTLLDRQAVIDARDDSGRTALMLATLHGQTRAVDVLLAHGADPNAADTRGTTPLQAAIAGNQEAIAAALQRAGGR
jgi:Ankyrin repeats (3 copies)